MRDISTELQMNTEQKRSALRIDLQLIADMVEPSSRLLDIGCGDGSLLEYLWHEKDVDGRGIELSMEGVNACVSQGLSVIQGDADTDLFNYPDHAFDFVILAQTLQATRAPKEVLENLLRIGRRAIVSLPNFGYWRVRLSLALQGRMPHTETLPHNWYDTPNIHFCTIRDFVDLCDELEIVIEKSFSLDSAGRGKQVRNGYFNANLLGEQGVFLLSQSKPA